MTEDKNDELENKESEPEAGERLEEAGPEVREKEVKSEGDESKALKNRLRKKETELKQLKKEKEDLHDRFLRAAAEMDNLRKRFEREKTEYIQYAQSDLLRDFLAVVDNFERALQSQDEGDGKTFREGVEMIYRQSLDLLRKKGVQPVEVKDQKFDPNVQQALITEESEEVDEPMVSEQFQKGYSLHNRLLRPALVKVIVPKKRQ